MKNRSKVLIYRGIIQYILESTDYSLDNIADLADCSVEEIDSIYNDSIIPPNFLSETQLLKIYQLVLSLQPKKSFKTKYLVEINPILA
jgi:hypothetical protein